MNQQSQDTSGDLSTDTDDKLILTINSGSSSVRFALYRMGKSESLVFVGKLERIGVEGGEFHAKDAKGVSLIEEKLNLPDHAAAFEVLMKWLENRETGARLNGVAHRLVHGGAAHLKPTVITSKLLNDLDGLIPLAPDHLPHELSAIKTVGKIFHDLPQIACFDTAFHRRMPAVAQRYALPAEYHRAGVIRYGFHGLSYEYILQEFEKETGTEAMKGRLVIAHLGNGASMAAFLDGESQDTTMGMTPTGGLAMSTRSGDLDPGVILYLLMEEGLSAEAVDDLLNHQAGLLGVSEISSDMEDLLAREETEPRAAEAVALFCYQARKFLGALAAVLGGLDTLIFTGGIGENSAIIRRRICQHMEFLGISLDSVRNDAHAALISNSNSRVAVRVMKTNEELMIARHAYQLL